MRVFILLAFIFVVIGLGFAHHNPSSVPPLNSIAGTMANAKPKSIELPPIYIFAEKAK